MLNSIRFEMADWRQRRAAFVFVTEHLFPVITMYLMINEMNGVSGHFVHIWAKLARRTSWGWWDNGMALPSRHSIQNLDHGGLRPSLLLLSHGGTQYWIFASEQGRNILFLWNLNDRAGFKPAIADFPSRQLYKHWPRAPTHVFVIRWNLFLYLNILKISMTLI